MEWLRKNNHVWKEKYSKNISEGLKLAYKEGRLEAKPFYDFSGKKHTEDAKRKIGEKNSVYQKGNKNSQFGTCWVYNLKQKKNLKIKEKDLQKYLSSNWIRGRKMNF